MEHKYSLNPAISLLCEQIEPGSKEQEVQALWESLLWTVFPASSHWLNLTKYKHGATEPDSKVMKLTQFNAGWAPIDLLIIELKRPRERNDMDAFNTVARNLLDDHMSESTNPENTTLFGGVGIGHYVVFYYKVLPSGRLQTTQVQPLHILHDAAGIQEIFNYQKSNIPQWPSLVPAPNPAPVLMGQSSGAYDSSIANYAAQDSNYEAPPYAPEQSYQAPGSDNPGPSSGYREGQSEHREGGFGSGPGDTTGADDYTCVQVTREHHRLRPDEFVFRDRSGRARTTTRNDWQRMRLSGQRCWVYRKYACYDDIFH